MTLTNFIRQNVKKGNHQTIKIIIDQFKAVIDTTDILSNGVKVMVSDLQRIQREYVNYTNMMQRTTQELENVKKSIHEQNVFYDNIKADQETYEKELSLKKQQLKETISAKHDGTFIWKIDSLKQKIGKSSMNLIYFDMRMVNISFL